MLYMIIFNLEKGWLSVLLPVSLFVTWLEVRPIPIQWVKSYTHPIILQIYVMSTVSVTNHWTPMQLNNNSLPFPLVKMLKTVTLNCQNYIFMWSLKTSDKLCNNSKVSLLVKWFQKNGIEVKRWSVCESGTSDWTNFNYVFTNCTILDRKTIKTDIAKSWFKKKKVLVKLFRSRSK